MYQLLSQGNDHVETQPWIEEPLSLTDVGPKHWLEEPISPAPTDVGPMWRSDGELPSHCSEKEELDWATRKMEKCRREFLDAYVSGDPKDQSKAGGGEERTSKVESSKAEDVEAKQVAGEKDGGLKVEESQDLQQSSVVKTTAVEANESHDPTTQLAEQARHAKHAEPTNSATGHQSPLLSSIKFADGKSLLEVKASTWVTQKESKETLRQAKVNAEAEAKALPEIPPPPESLGKVPSLSPEEQCPPKRRGRKPKPDNAEKKKANATKRSRSKGSKAGLCCNLSYMHNVDFAGASRQAVEIHCWYNTLKNPKCCYCCGVF
jgi:hypothetical protein